MHMFGEKIPLFHFAFRTIDSHTKHLQIIPLKKPHNKCPTKRCSLFGHMFGHIHKMLTYRNLPGWIEWAHLRPNESSPKPSVRSSVPFKCEADNTYHVTHICVGTTNIHAHYPVVVVKAYRVHLCGTEFFQCVPVCPLVNPVWQNGQATSQSRIIAVRVLAISKTFRCSQFALRKGQELRNLPQCLGSKAACMHYSRWTYLRICMDIQSSLANIWGTFQM